MDLGSILVTGGCGFLGSHLVSHLLEYAPESSISVVDLNTSNNIISPKVQYIRGDISSSTQLERIFQKVRPQAVFHTATPRPLRSNDALYERVTLGGTCALLQIAKEVGTVKAFVLVSSVAVIDDYTSEIIHGNDTMPVLENSRELYAAYKARAENLVLAANSPTMKTVSIRPCAIFGERDDVTTSRILMQARNGNLRFQFGGGRNKFDFVYVANVVDALVIVAQRLLESHISSEDLKSDMRVDGEAFIVTNGESTFFWDFVRKLGAAAGHPTRSQDIWVIPKALILGLVTLSEWLWWIFTLGSKQPFLYKTSVLECTWERTYSMEKAKMRLEYSPGVSLDEGIRRSAAWFLKEHPKET